MISHESRYLLGRVGKAGVARPLGLFRLNGERLHHAETLEHLPVAGTAHCIWETLAQFRLIHFIWLPGGKMSIRI